MLFREVTHLLRKEFIFEFRQKYALNGIVLYLVGTIFICYLSFNLQPGQLHSITWNALFWIIVLFTAVSAVAKSFLQESPSRFSYYYSVASAQGIIIAKMVYYSLLLVALTLSGYLVFSLVLGNPVNDPLLFLTGLVLGAVGLAASLTLISSIAAKADGNQTLMAVLGLPVLIPVILTVLKLSKNAIDGLERSVSTDEILILIAIDLMVLSLSLMLFPYIWRS